MNRIQRLAELGQSAWLDDLDRRLLTSGDFRRMVEQDGLRGVTSNPTIFQKAIASSDDYDALIREAAPGESDASILERIMVRDLTLACDELRPAFERSNGADGFASIEVDPLVADDTTAQIEQATRLWRAVDRPNLMVKIPATAAGVPAIETCLACGININVTLLFSVERYREVTLAFLSALEQRVRAGEPIDRLCSVASFFVSRVDTKVDKLLDAMPGARELRGKIAIANAKLAYEEYERTIASDRWKALAAKGARPQRVLWGSTSPKDPAYGDTYYIDALIGRDTVDTMTQECFRAFLDHGKPEPRLDRGREEAHREIEALAELRIDFSKVTEALEREGVEKFAESYRKSLKAIADKRHAQAESLTQAHELARQLRIDSLRCSTAAKSGHPTSSLSAADLIAVLVSGGHLRWDTSDPTNANNDHLVFSKGHASPLLYSMLKAVGVLTDAELMTYRRLGSRLQGHPVPILPGIEVATGSLGQGLPVAVGMALSGKILEKRGYRVWVLVGDSEMSEGSIWEAFDHARYYRLGNLVVILDMNRLGQSRETPLGWDGDAYAARAESFGWRAIQVDGHDLASIERAYAEAEREPELPVLIIAHTLKGKGVPLVENKEGWHGKALDEAQCAQAIEQLGGRPEPAIQVRPSRPTPAVSIERASSGAATLPVYERSKRVATRKAYGEALAAMAGARNDIVALDAEVSNSTYSEDVRKTHAARYLEMFISEQQMIAAAVGLAVRGWTPFASTFAAFLTRGYDFIRMAAVSNANVRLCGSHAGVSIGEDGPSQMGLEDLAMMRAVHGSTVLYPCCANQTAKLVALMADLPGIVYLRTTREKLPVLYDRSETFVRGGSKVLRATPRDRATIVAAGITVHEALEAHDHLATLGVPVRVVDAYSIKPIDSETLRACAQVTNGTVVVVEDHWAEGGLGDAVRACFGEPRDFVGLKLAHLAVREMPGSGTPSELLHAAGIDAAAVVRAVVSLLAKRDRVCFMCGKPATWTIAVAGEDERGTEEDACELHARGHIRRAPLSEQAAAGIGVLH
jgi:transketolase